MAGLLIGAAGACGGGAPADAASSPPATTISASDGGGPGTVPPESDALPAVEHPEADGADAGGADKERKDRKTSDRGACRLLTPRDAEALLGEDAEEADQPADDEVPTSSAELEVDACHYYAKRARRRVSVAVLTVKAEGGRVVVDAATSPVGANKPAPEVDAGAVWNSLTESLRVPHAGRAVVMRLEPAEGVEASAADAKKVWDVVRSRL